MNAEGDTLLVGVTDEGVNSGIQADNFPNEDNLPPHFKNLVKQRIGLELSEPISFSPKRVDGHGLIPRAQPFLKLLFVLPGSVLKGCEERLVALVTGRCCGVHELPDDPVDFG